MKLNLFKKLPLFFTSYLVSLMIVSCGPQLDQGSTSVNISGAQFIAEAEFPDGLMLYARFVNQPWNGIAINLKNAPQDIPLPNGFYQMAMVGFKKNGNDFIAKCGSPQLNGAHDFNLNGGTVILNVVMSENNCVKDGPFASKRWVDPNADSALSKLRPFKIKACNGGPTNDALNPSCTPASSAQSVKVKYLSYKNGPLFQTAPVAPPVEMCMNMTGGLSNYQFFLPGGDYYDDPTDQGVFNSSVEFFSAANCGGSLLRNFDFPQGFDYHFRDISPDKAIMDNPNHRPLSNPPINQAQMEFRFNLGGLATDLPVAVKIVEGFGKEFGEIHVPAPIIYNFTIRNDLPETLTSMSGAVSGLGTTYGSFAFTGAYPGTNGTCGATLNPGASCTVELIYNNSGTTSTTAAEEVYKIDFTFSTIAGARKVTHVAIFKPVDDGLLELYDDTPTLVPAIPSFYDYFSTGIGTPITKVFKLRNDGEASVHVIPNSSFWDPGALANGDGDFYFTGGGMFPGAIATQQCPSFDFDLEKGEYCFIEINFDPSVGGTTDHDQDFRIDYFDVTGPSQSLIKRLRGTGI